MSSLVVGLGNPGRKYEGNRHNVGFLVADELVRGLALPDYREKFSGVFTKGDVALGGKAATDLVVLKPMTFMNLSGQSVQPAAAFLKVAPPDIVVVHDELDVPFGEVRVKVGGGHAGHNGLRSIIERLGPDFVRVRVGIGRPPADFRGEVADYVLHDFDAVERAQVGDLVARAVDAVRKVLTLGTQPAMNLVNAKAPPRNGPKKATPP
jgi:PTH1 family peptidyl-tRNA hydrolase